jgi:hypothetical protein
MARVVLPLIILCVFCTIWWVMIRRGERRAAELQRELENQRQKTADVESRLEKKASQVFSAMQDEPEN